jgi:hypothetical protein
MSDRVVVLIDYQNLHGWVRRLFLPVNAHPADGHVDPLRLAQPLVRRRRRPSALQGARVYRGRPSPDHQARAATANDRQTAAWQCSGAVTVIRRPLRYPADWPTAPAQEKGIDVALAIDMVAMALREEYDAAIVVSSNTDIMPAIGTVYAGRLGHVELATWAGARRLRFPRTQLPWCHFISEAEYRTLQDSTDYTQVSGSE